MSSSNRPMYASSNSPSGSGDRPMWFWAKFVGGLALMGVLLQPLRPVPPVAATDLTHAQGCALGRAAAERWGFSTIRQCDYRPSSGGGDLRGQSSWRFWVKREASGTLTVLLTTDPAGDQFPTVLGEFRFDSVPE